MLKIPVQLYVIHLALMMAPAMFAAVTFFIVLPEVKEVSLPPQDIFVFETVAAALAVIGVGTSQLIPRFVMRGEKHVPVQKYVSMKIVQWALLEGSAMFIGVVFFLSHEKNMLIPLGILIALMALMRPTIEEMQRYHVGGA